ncbi:dihydropteroate synthase [Hoylesella marshii]|uniref:dihydropteroate synthase n=1 Tax=Hoylesella marshii DSM 16973 = JCM 13450 TaxID=862515 RepID=E0NTU6_9BACT|nr:dihydropteroate synthase [Hoylesella marshii]EFM01479.1 dihydropteroate synthase [Hoylesella marshii DSM 16973 = JCM 13450]
MTKQFMEYTINIKGRLFDLSRPCVMGILNATPDSFYAGSRVQTEREIAERAETILREGAAIIDVGAFSTRPGATEVDEKEEMRRLHTALSIVRKEHPKAIISVDTYRPNVARMAVETYGADLINDVSEGGITGIADTPIHEQGSMFATVAALRVPYILMSVRSTLRDMMISWSREIQMLRDLGQKDIILDPGFGFGKTVEQNYTIMKEMDRLQTFRLPILVGISRKRMIQHVINTTADESLNGTTALNTLALTKGAAILRVHDVREAVEAVAIYDAMTRPAFTFKS